MPSFNVGSGTGRAKSERMQRFEQADRVVVAVFAGLHEAYHLKSKPSSGISPATVQRFERKAWDRLIEYLLRLPPLTSDY